MAAVSLGGSVVFLARARPADSVGHEEPVRLAAIDLARRVPYNHAMPMIHVARDGAKLGEFTLEQIRAGLTTGQFRPTDLAWQAGMAEWRPLSELVGATAAPPPAAAAPLATTIAPAAAASGLPWEHRQQLGIVKTWLDTVSLLIARPGEAFTMMRPEGGLLDPLLFGLIGGCAGSVVSILFQGLMRSVPGFGGREDFFHFFGVGPLAFIIIYAVLSPLLVTFGLFLTSAVFHLCLIWSAAPTDRLKRLFASCVSRVALRICFP